MATCDRCAKDDLIWDQVGGKWRLHEQNGHLHDCGYAKDLVDCYRCGQPIRLKMVWGLWTPYDCVHDREHHCKWKHVKAKRNENP